MPSSARSISPWLLCGAVTALCGCASGLPARKPAVEPPPILQARVYDCEGTEAITRQLEDDQIELRLPSRSVLLPRVRSGSGVKYAAAGTTFWVKGPIAMLELPARRPAKCEEDRPSSLREDALARDVHYRGLGSEPGWNIEIGPEAITFEYDYGESQMVFPLGPPRLGPDDRRTYEQSNASQRLSVVIENAICLDPMTGDAFATKVEVRLDDRTFRGCGDALR